MKFALLAITVTAAATTTPPMRPALTEKEACVPECLDPITAVVLANRLAPQAMAPVRVLMTVRSVDKKDNVGPDRATYFFLNSESDYRSPISVNIHLRTANSTRSVKKLEFESLRREFFNKRIVVQGTLRRVRIDFTTNGTATGKYYYQTHIYIDGTDRIALIDDSVSQTSSTNRP